MASFTNTLISVTGQSGTVSGNTYNTSRNRSDFIVIQANITAGTASVVIEGRNSPLGQWVTLTTISTTDTQSIVRTPQIRARLATATGATVLVTTDDPVRG